MWSWPSDCRREDFWRQRASRTYPLLANHRKKPRDTDYGPCDRHGVRFFTARHAADRITPSSVELVIVIRVPDPALYAVHNTVTLLRDSTRQDSLAMVQAIIRAVQDDGFVREALDGEDFRFSRQRRSIFIVAFFPDESSSHSALALNTHMHQHRKI